MDPRLQSAIGNPRIQSQAGELIRLALAALEDLKQLDESLYERFVASRDAPDEATGVRVASLRLLWDDTFDGLLQLLAFCSVLGTTAAKSEPEPAIEPSFEFGDLEGGGAPIAESNLDLGSSDIGDLLAGIDEHVQEGTTERWAKVLEKVASIEYGLRSQHSDATSRLKVALLAGEFGQVLGLLDDTQSAASEGVHALISAVYEAFVPDVSPTTVVPGYLTSLGRALLVRRGLAELAATLGPYNLLLQGDERSLHAVALAAVRDTMRGFVSSVVCRAMRAADRWQVVQFEQELAEQPAATARLTSEGLVKYLDSLGSINQREVLVLHDQRTLEQMRESLANARQLIDISPRTASEMMDRAYDAAQRLRGRHPDTDQLVIQLERYAPSSSNPAEHVQFLERLEKVLESTET